MLIEVTLTAIVIIIIFYLHRKNKEHMSIIIGDRETVRLPNNINLHTLFKFMEYFMIKNEKIYSNPINNTNIDLTEGYFIFQNIKMIFQYLDFLINNDQINFYNRFIDFYYSRYYYLKDPVDVPNILDRNNNNYMLYNTLTKKNMIINLQIFKEIIDLYSTNDISYFNHIYAPSEISLFFNLFIIPLKYIITGINGIVSTKMFIMFVRNIHFY